MESPSDMDLMTRCMSSFSYKIKSGKRFFRCRNQECQMPFPSDYSRKNHEKAAHDPETILQTRAPTSNIVGMTIRSSKKRQLQDRSSVGSAEHLVSATPMIQQPRPMMNYTHCVDDRSHHEMQSSSSCILPRTRLAIPPPLYLLPSQLSTKHYSSDFEKASHSETD